MATRSCPEAWVDYERTPFADVPEYGAHWWVTGAKDKVPDVFAADGFNGQSIIVVPEPRPRGRRARQRAGCAP